VMSTLAAGAPFDGFIALSPTLGWNGEQVVAQIDARLASRPAQPKQLYASVATGDTEIYRASFDRLMQLLAARKAAWLNTMLERLSGDDHVTAVGPALQRAMKWFFVK
jgi:hypothetical protein